MRTIFSILDMGETKGKRGPETDLLSCFRLLVNPGHLKYSHGCDLNVECIFWDFVCKPQSLVLFGAIMEPLGDGALMEKLGLGRLVFKDNIQTEF